MAFVKLENNQPVEWPVQDWQIRLQYPETSLPEYLTPEVVAPLGYAPFVYEGYPPEYDPQWENIEEIAPILKEDGKYHQSYKITEKYTPEEKKAIQDEQARQSNKSRAEQLLQETDWTATVDINNPQFSNPYLGNQDAFLAYRSQVRQIAINPPVIVEVWPTKPDEVWVSV